MDKVLLVIPAYNEGKNIERVVDHIKNDFPELDYVVVNDGSKDDTADICRRRGYNFIDLPVNLGLAGCFQTGMKYAWQKGYNYAVQFDGDGQHDAAFLQEMRDYMYAHDLDMLIGSRFIEKEGFQSSSLRRFGIRYFSGLIRLLTGKRITDPTSGMRMVNESIIKMYADCYPKDYPEPESVVAVLQAGKKVEEYPVVMRERKEGVSSISPLKSVYYMIKVTLAILVERIRRKEYKK